MGETEPFFESIIWAFCFITSAGVSIRQETISAADEAMPWIIGVGREWVNGRGRAILEPWV
jgi:hypothetical protein